MSRFVSAELLTAIQQTKATCAVFRSSDNFSASAANRDSLKHFFTEVASAETLGCERVWIPGGLWDLRTAVKLATELGVTCSFDPTVRDPNDPPEVVPQCGILRLDAGRPLAAIVFYRSHLLSSDTAPIEAVRRRPRTTERPPRTRSREFVPCRISSNRKSVGLSSTIRA